VFSFEVYPENRYGIYLPLALVGYSVFVTWSYLIIKNPVFHQVSYAILVFIIVYRSTQLVRQLPKTSPERPQLALLLRLAAAGFIGAFFVWNIDNQFCEHLRAWRLTVHVAVGAISQLHGLWHIMTGEAL
jgi:dihydroceramidase